MSEDMSSSWKYLGSAGSRLTSLKSYISNKEPGTGWRSPKPAGTPNAEEKQGWRAWAGQKIRVRRRGADDLKNGITEMVNVFPGWAARRYAADSGEVPRPFEVEVFVSGFAISHRSPENASRSQRAFIRLAKGFAALPKLVESATDIAPNSSSLAHLTPSTEELLAKIKLPPRPDEITEDFDVEALDRQLKRAKATDVEDDEDGQSESPSTSSSRSSTYDFPVPDTGPRTPQVIEGASMPIEVLRQLHANLERRLQPFWSSVLPNRTVRLHLFASPHQDHARDATVTNATFPASSSTLEEELPVETEHGPLASQDVVTAADGSFQVKFKVNWEQLCQHPTALHIAFGESVEEHELLVVAQLLPLSGAVSQTPQSESQQSYFPYQPRQLPNKQSQSQNSFNKVAAKQTTPPTPKTPSVPLASLTRIPITHSPIRVISDIDDTVKLSGVLSGARAVFHNVFVKDLQDNVIPGMGDWYTQMWTRGVRFHYVSNGPFEYLPVLNEFFLVSQLPPGSLKLRSYAGRSLFNGLLTAPAARKRAGVVDVLNSFPDSCFFLIGDTGEQDLELYADLARERPKQILGAFLRDADALTIGGPEALDDPTGWKAMGAAGTRPNERPLVPRSETGNSVVSGVSSSSSPALSFLNKYSSKVNDGTRTPTSNLRAAEGDINRTPRPNRYTLDGVRSPFGGGSKGTPRSGFSMDDAVLGKSVGQQQQQTYFSNGPMSAEPESSEYFPSMPSSPSREGLDSMMTPTQASTAQMEPSKTITSQMNTIRVRPPTVPPSPSTQAYINQPPKPTPPPSITQPQPHNLDPSSVSFRSQQTGSSTSSVSSSASRKGSLTEAEKKRDQLQLRVYRARTQMPSHVPLRVFRDPRECVEAQEILEREGWGEGGGKAMS